MKLQADAEHQQDDADFRELLGYFRVGDKSRRVRTDQRAGEQVAHDWGETGSMREVTKDEGCGETSRQCEDQIDVAQ